MHSSLPSLALTHAEQWLCMFFYDAEFCAYACAHGLPPVVTFYCP